MRVGDGVFRYGQSDHGYQPHFLFVVYIVLHLGCKDNGSKMVIRRKSKVVVGVFTVLFAALILAVMIFLGFPPGLHTHVYWLFTSAHNKQEVLSSSKIQNQLLHTEWNGDGWGGAPVGDWMGYVVYDPSDSLPQIKTSEPQRKINGIPCDVVSVRRLEKGWYSVVTDMNQFWDIAQPSC